MSYLRYLLAPVLVSLILLLTGALSLYPARTAASAPALPLAPAVEDPAADELLSQAVAMLRPERITWLRAAIWQQVACADFSYQAEGTYLSGPGNRLRLQLNVLLGKTRSELCVVSDGATLWQIMSVADSKPVITRTELGVKDLEHRGANTEARAALLHGQGLTGIHPLLEDLRQRMIVTRQEAVSWKDRDVKRLTLVWRDAEAAKLAPPGQAWPSLLPHKCLVYLDASTLWPHRMEWWSPDRRAGEKLVLQMELRNPVLNRPLTSAECDKEFSFDPGPEKVPDLTDALTASVAPRPPDTVKAGPSASKQ